jgi:hypothetical protein
VAQSFDKALRSTQTICSRASGLCRIAFSALQKASNKEINSHTTFQILYFPQQVINMYELSGIEQLWQYRFF